MASFLRTILWRNEDFHMYEYCALKDAEQGFQIEGVVVTVVEEKPVRIAYQIVLDQNGLTRLVEVDAVGELVEQHLRLVVDEQRNWHWNGKELPECRGFSDVDLGFSPSTNALPIRRLNLNIGESQTLTVTWVRFPEFDVVAFPQRYTRLGTNRYLFESLLSDFKAELVVDELGMVQQYGNYWESVASF
jgi:uncharacterized protein